MLSAFAFTPIWRSLLLTAANLMALLIYAVGLVAPLTPSEGSPSLLVILMFVGSRLPFSLGASELVARALLPFSLVFS
jgi:hypothetical protein